MKIRKTILKIICKHDCREDKGVVKLWNGTEKMLTQCVYCGALIVNDYNIGDPLPDMMSKIK